MTRIVFSSNQNGTGTFTISAPVSNTNRTITIPDVTGNILTDSQIATQSEAIAGADNTKLMTPLRVAQVAVAVPAGGIILWSGASNNIPSGWFLCDGQNGTPNLLDRFVVGAGSTYAVNATGGSAAVTLSTTQIPSHTHTFTGTTGNESVGHTHSGTTGTVSQDHTHSYQDTGGNSGTGGGESYDSGAFTLRSFIRTTAGINQNHTHSFTTGAVSANHTHSITGTTGAAGSGSSHENRPPYYALCYIMKG